MRLIINASGTKATGVTQVVVSFICECRRHPENQYYIFMSERVASELKNEAFPENFQFHLFHHKPHFNFKGLKTWLKLVQLEKKIQPDVVFSVFGPSIWQPHHPHLMGFAYPYYIYPESPYFQIISFKRKTVIKLQQAYHKFFFQRNGEHFVCETEDVAKRLPNYLKCRKDNIYIVTNTFNSYFDNFEPIKKTLLPPKQQSEFRFVTLSTFASHKNLSILNDIIPILNERLENYDIRFILTVDEALLKKRINPTVQKQIYNLGRIPVAQCPQAYFESDALFLPTLMECFSASYAEAMKMGKPIITSNLPFAHTVCDEAALYFSPLDPNDIVDAILKLVLDQELRSSLREKGFSRLKEFDTAISRTQKYLDICKKLMNNC